MAIPSKKNINFDVYERQDPTTQVDWGAQATKITETFEGIRDERQGRKDLLEKNIEEQRVALNDIGEYDSQNLRQLALKSSQQSAEELARKAALMRAGKIKPNELMQFKSNQSAGWTLFKKNAESWNGKFVEYTERMNAVPPLSSKLEQQLAQSLAGFGNLENMSYLTDDDGNMSYVRTDEAGNIIPGESISANELTNLLNQKIDNYDSVAAAKSAGEKIGTIVTEILEENGINATISSDARSKAESDYFGSEAAAEVLRKYADTMTAVPQNLAVMLTQNVNIPDTKTVYEGDYGGKLHDAWAKENADKDQSLNPYIAMRMKSGTYVADVTEEQKAVATEYAEGLIRSTLNIKKGVDTKGMNEARGKTTAEFADDIRKKEIRSTGVLLNEFVTLDINTANAAGNAIVLKYNKEKDKDAPVMTQFLRVDKKATQLDVDKGYADEVGQDIIGSYDIKIEGMIIKPLDAYDEDGNQISVKNAITTLWQEAGLEGDPTDFLNDKDAEIGESLGSGNAGGRGREKEIPYSRTPTNKITGVKIKMEDWVAIMQDANDGGFGSKKKISEIDKAFKALIREDGFMPPRLKGVVNKVESKDGKLIITIGDSEVQVDNYQEIDHETLVDKIQDTIFKEVNRISGGGKNKKIYVG